MSRKEEFKFDFEESKDQLITKIKVAHALPLDIQTNPEKLKCFNFRDLVMIANCRIIIPLLENEHLRKLINSPEIFMDLCFSYNIHLTFKLLEDERIRQMMMPYFKDAKNYYFKINYREPDKQKKIFSLVSTQDSKLSDIKSKREEKTSTPDLEDQNQKELLANFLTIKDYTENMLYGNKLNDNLGFYSSGFVDFKKHFSTYASDKKWAPALAGGFAAQIYHARLKLLKTEIIDPKDKFVVLECGAGKGDLCWEILTTIYKMAESDKDWEELKTAIEYNIIEKSGPLAERQKETNKDLGDKVIIRQGDARSLKTLFAKESVAVAISNELIDSIMPDVITYNDKRGFVIKQVVVRIRIENFKKLDIDRSLRSSLEMRSKNLVALLGKYGYHDQDFLVLSGEDFLKLLELLKRKIDSISFSFLPLHIVGIKHDPKIYDYVSTNFSIFNRIHANRTYFLQIDAREYLRELYHILIPQGEVITIDYCYDPHGFSLSSQFKVVDYGKKEVISDDIFGTPGCEDISVGVDMTHLAQTKGFRTLFYGKQEQLRLDFPEKVLSSESKFLFKQVSALGKFVVLVQHKLKDGEKEDQLETDSKRFEGEPLPVTQLQINQKLQHIFSVLSDYPHQELYREASGLCQARPNCESYLNEIKQKNYATALRKAAAAGSLPLVSVLLKYKNWLSKDYNINEKSSNGKTAYDWVAGARVDASIKDQIRKMLVHAGAIPPVSAHDKLCRDHTI